MTTDTTPTTPTTPPENRADVAARIYSPEELQAIDKAQIERAQHDLKFFARTLTQGDWLDITRRLDMSRAAIGEDNNLTLLALAYVKEKRAHGSASIDVLLQMTDADLLEAHGFPASLLDADEGDE